MDSQNHKITAVKPGHEVHGVHLCHRCGWPFPKPHPSAKHRRSHKRVCGKVDGYKFIHSEENDNLHHIAVSDDDKSSDEDGHTTNPKLVKKNSEEFGSSSGVGEKSNRSEDDVFSDAVTDFSDSGISPRIDKIIELKSVDDDVYRSQLLEVDEIKDKTKQLNDPPSSDQISYPGANNKPVIVNENGDEGLHKGLMKTDIQVEEDKLASMASQTLIEVERNEEICDKLASAEEKNVGEMALTEETSVNVDTFVELEKVSEYSDGVSVDKEMARNENRKMGSNDKFSVEAVSQASRDLGKDSNQFDDKSNSKLLEAGNESIEGGAIGEVQLSGEYNLGAGNLEELSKTEPNSLETTDSFEKSYQEFDTGEVDKSSPTTFVNDIVHATTNVHVTKDDAIVESVVEQDFSPQTKSPQNTVKHSTETVGEMDLTEETSVKVDTFVDLEKVSDSVKQNTSLVGNSDISECEMAENENRKMGSNDKFSLEAVSQDDQASRDFGKHSNHFDDKSNSVLLEAQNESSEGATGEVQLMLDSETPTVNSTEDNLGAGNLEELSKTESNSVETTDYSFEKSYQEVDTGEVDKSSPTTFVNDLDHAMSNVHVTKNDVIVESVDVAELKDNEDVVASVTIPEIPISKESQVLSKNEDVADNNIYMSDGVTSEKSVDAAEVITEPNHDNNDVILSESSEGPTSRLQEALPMNGKCSPDVEEKHTSEDVSISKSFGIVPGADIACDVNVVTSNNLSENHITEEPIHETCATGGDKNIINGEQEDDDSAIDLSNSRSDSLEANCGSISALSSQSNVAVADTSSQSPDTLKTTTEKSDLFEPPSFMTLVQSSEIETVHNNQQPKSDALQVGWFPSITNVVNESEGRKKNEEIIAKVTNWNPVKQHSPLKNLLNEVDSPNTKQIPAEPKDNGKSIMAPEAPIKDQETNKVMEEWNSPARYPIEIKKEKKKKGRPYWVPFVCCSSVHRDM